MRLVLCPSCQRHVRDDAPTCPFCGDANTALATGPDRVARLGRAAIMAFGVAAGAATLDACKKESDSIAQPYGAPPNPPTPIFDAGTAPSATATPTTPETAIAQPYGAPPTIVPDASAAPMVDAGAKKDSGAAAAVTATATATTPIRNLKKPYGAPPVPLDEV